jgi:hypothetical protein
MHEFLDMYKKGGASLASAAFDYLVGDLLIKEKRGAEKARELTALDMESKSPMDFVPAMIYTFLYVSDTPEVAGKVQFKDMVPMILCFTSNSNSVTGLNFNMIPNDVRASILDLIVRLTKEPMFDDSGKFKANETMGKLFIVPNGVKAFLAAVENETGLNVSSAVRTYKIEFIKRMRMVEYDMWKYVPALSFKDSIRGAGLADIQATMIKANSQSSADK